MINTPGIGNDTVQDQENIVATDNINVDENKKSENMKEQDHIQEPPKVKNLVPASFDSNKEYDIKAETSKFIEILDDGYVKCTVCGKMSNGKERRFRIQSMQCHVEIHM